MPGTGTVKKKSVAAAATVGSPAAGSALAKPMAVAIVCRMLPSLVSRTCTAFVPRSSVVKTKPSAVSPGAIGPSRKP